MDIKITENFVTSSVYFQVSDDPDGRGQKVGYRFDTKTIFDLLSSFKFQLIKKLNIYGI